MKFKAAKDQTVSNIIYRAIMDTVRVIQVEFQPSDKPNIG